MFAVQPSIDSTGQLIFTPAANANGTAVLTVTLTMMLQQVAQRSRLPPRTLTISVTAVYDAAVIGGDLIGTAVEAGGGGIRRLYLGSSGHGDIDHK